MEYKKQDLRAGGLSGQFETLENFTITKPVWKNSFGENFFLTSIPSLEGINTLIVNVIDTKDINGEEYVISNQTDTTIDVSLGGTVIYSGVKGKSEKALSLRGGYNVVSTGSVTEVGEEDPTTKDTNDVFQFGYIKIKVSATYSIGDYITFTSNETNLQGITTRIHYVEGDYCFIRGTNLKGTLPNVGDLITIHNKIGDVLVIAEKDKVVSVDNQGNTIILYECNSDDEIIDLEYFNSTLFILTNNFVFYGRSLINTNMNIYPLDFFDNMVGGNRILSFGKHLILFGQDNQVISPINSTGGSIGYVTNGLNFNHKLFSKYSALTSQGSLYILQEDKQFVKVDIVAVANGEYDLITTDAMADVKGMLDDIEGEVFITKSNKYISIINKKSDGTTDTYNYNILYKHWTEWKYNFGIRSLGDYNFGDTQYTEGDNFVNQELSFQLGGESLYNMKTCFFVKMILVAEEDRVPDYTLTIDKYIGGLKYTKVVNLKDYPINNKILRNDTSGSGYDQFGDSFLYEPEEPDDLGYLINLNVRINETADMFIFTLRNKENKITYGGSVIGYRNWQPEVTAYNYTIKNN